MIRIGRIKAAVAAVTVIGATAAAMLVPASPAVAFSSGGLVLDVVVQSPAQLIAKGAAVAVPVDYTCFDAFNATVEVSVTQHVGTGIASGGGSLNNTTCNGEIQTATIDIPASPGGKAFTKGVAFAAANFFGCSSSLCGQESDNRTISINR